MARPRHAASLTQDRRHVTQKIGRLCPSSQPNVKGHERNQESHFAVPSVTSKGIGREKIVSSPSSVRSRPLMYISYRAGSVALVVVTTKVPPVAVGFMSITRMSFTPTSSTLTSFGGV